MVNVVPRIIWSDSEVMLRVIRRKDDWIVVEEFYGENALGEKQWHSIAYDDVRYIPLIISALSNYEKFHWDVKYAKDADGQTPEAT